MLIQSQLLKYDPVTQFSSDVWGKMNFVVDKGIKERKKDTGKRHRRKGTTVVFINLWIYIHIKCKVAR